MTYIIIIILLFYYATVHDIKGSTHNRRLHYRIMFWTFFLLAGLAQTMGGDSYQYMMFWDTLPLMGHATWEDLTVYRYDMGWVLMCFVLKSFFGGFVSLQLLLSFVLNVGLFKVIKKYSSYPFVVLLLFFLSVDQYFHIEIVFMRQACAIAIFFIWGLEYLEQRKYLKYFLSVIICGLFHFSSLALIILPVFWEINFDSKRTVYRLISIAVVFGIGLFVVLNHTHLAEIKGMLRLVNALETAGEKVETNELKRFFNMSYSYILYYMVILWGAKKYHIKIPFKGALFFGVFVILLSPYVGDFGRLMLFVIIIIDICLATIVVRFSKRLIPLFLCCMIIFTIGSNIINFERYRENTFFIYPYYTWFEEEPASHKENYRNKIQEGFMLNFQVYDLRE